MFSKKSEDFHFDQLKAHFMVENKMMRLIFAVVVILSLLIIFFLVSQKTYFLWKNREFLGREVLLTEVCQEGFQGIAKGTPNSYLIDQLIFKELEKNAFLVPIEKWVSVKEVGEDRCHLILKSEGKLVAFSVHLKKGADYPFIYKISEIHEMGIDEFSL